MSATNEADAVPDDRGQRAHRWALAALAFACTLLALRGWNAAVRPSGSDFTIYYRAAQAVLERRDPMEVVGFLYLPAFAVAIAPIALLPYAIAAALWQILSLAALAACVRRAAQLATLPGERPAPWLLWVPLACVLRLADSNLANGQVNAFTLWLALEGVWRLRRGDTRAAGISIGLAVVAKLLPLLLFVFLAAKRAWRSLGWAVASALLAAALLPAVALGPGRALDAHAHWWHEVVDPYREGGRELLEQRDYLPGQSLTAASYRLLTRTPATSRGDEGPDANLIDLDPDLVRELVLAASALHVLAWIATMLLRPSRADERAWAIDAALGVCTLLLVGPIVHKAHMLWLLFPYAAIVASPRPKIRPLLQLVRAALVLASVVLIAGTTPAIVGRAMATGLLSHNAIYFGLEAVWLALLVERWSERRDVARSPARSANELAAESSSSDPSRSFPTVA